MDVAIVNPIGATPDLTPASFLRAGGASAPPNAAALREVNIVELGAAIADLGHRVNVVLGGPSPADQAVPLSERLAVLPMHALRVFPFHPGLLPLTPELRRHPALLDADVIQSGEFHQPSTFFAAEVSRRREVPLVVWQETFEPMRFPVSLYQRGYEATVGRTVRAAAAQYAPRTTKARAYLRRIRVPDEAIGEWLPTGVDVQTFRPGTSALSPEDFGWPHESEILLVVARLNRTKGVDIVLRVLKRLQTDHPALRLLVRGSGPEEPELRAFAGALGIADLVRFLPRCTREEMVDLYNLATVVVSASRKELLPFTLMEASACGRPVVATDAGAETDIVVDRRTGCIVPPGDEERLAHVVSVLLRDEETRRAYGRAARERAEALFDVRRTARRFVEVYHAAS